MTPPEVLDEALRSIDHLWSQPAPPSPDPVHVGYQQVTVAQGGRITEPGFATILAEFAPVFDAWVSRIAPGGFVAVHIDAGRPYRERWQVPFTETGELLADGQPVAHEVGVPFRVHHHLWHSVRNTSSVPRISLVIDRDVLAGVPDAPFQRRFAHVDR